MMDETQNKQSKLQEIIEGLKTRTFGTMLELLKDKKASKWYSSLLMLIMFVQLVGFLFDGDNGFPWRDDYLLDAFNQVCRFARLLPAIEDANSASFFWILYFAGVAVITVIIGLFIYTIYSLSIKKFYFLWPVNFLKGSLTILFWILFLPLMEAFLSVFNCENGHHKIDTSLECYQGVHIFFVVLSIIFILLLLGITVLAALFYNETQPIQEDAFSRVEDSTELLMLLYRTGIAIYSTFVTTEVGNWVLIFIFLVASILMSYQYFMYVPYYNTFVSVFWGSLVCNYCWISINALLMMILDVYGHIIVICIGVPIIAGLVKNLREMRIQHLLLLNMEKMKTAVDGLTQIITIQQMVKAASVSQAEDVTLIGIVNLHVLECQNADCPCKNEAELFDASTGKFSKRDTGYHKDTIFLCHFTKRLYEDALNKFINSPVLHIAFSYYLFETMKNVHAALVELNIAAKKKPSLQQQFTIYRYKSAIENHIKAESTQAKDIYMQLTNVTEFEKLLGECQKAIEKVCNFQIEFWSQIANQLPDLNILHDLGNKIYDATKEAEDFWTMLCKINSNYAKALNLYGNYMIEIKNHNQVGYELLEKAKVNTNKKSIDELIKSSDILFADDTVVLHISGNKETGGRIVKTNQGLTKIFGYSKTEVMGHFVNILMPSMFAKRHNEFLEKYFKTGHKTVFNTERYFFGLHRNGFCFCIKMLVKQMPSLAEGIQYVGMIRQSQGDCDYILADMRGVIDSFSSGITSLLNLPASIFKDSDINIQILAPELIKVFSATDKKRTLLGKFQEPGGQKLSFIVPKDFAFHAQSESKKNARDIGKNLQTKSGSPNSPAKKTKNPAYRDLNKDLNKHNGIASKQVNIQQLLQSYEYRECENKQTVKCEIQEPAYGEEHKDIEPLRIRVFKVTGINMKRAGSGVELSSDVGDAYGNYGGSHSNASYDWKESKGPNNMVNSGELGKQEEVKQDLMNFVVNSQADRGRFREGKDEEKDKEAPVTTEKREDTKTTEKIPGNTLTTEGHAETLEAKPVLKVKMTADAKTGSIRKTAKEVMAPSPAHKREEKKEHSSEEAKSIQSAKPTDFENLATLQVVHTGSENQIKGTEETLKLGLGEDSKRKEEKPTTTKEELKKDENNGKPDAGESTPKMDLGNLKGPEFAAAGSHIAEENTVHPPDESIFESESGKSTGRANVKAIVKEEAKKESKARSHISSGKLLEENKAAARKAAGEKEKAGTVIGKKSSDKKPSSKEEKDEYNVSESGGSNNSNPEEEVVPLDKIKIDMKISQAEPNKNVKVPSVLDEGITGLVHKTTAEDKKKPPHDSSSSKDKAKPEDEASHSEKKFTMGKVDSEAAQQQKLKEIEGASAKEGEELEPGKMERKPSKESEKPKDQASAMRSAQEEGKKVLLHQRRSMKGRKKFVSKIISNPMYDAEGRDSAEFPEYKPTDEEIKVRRALLAFEKKKNKEKKKADKDKKEEAKKTEEKEEKEEGKEEDKEKDEDKDEEDGDEEKEDKNEGNKVPEDDGEENQDTQSSVTSGSTGSTMRSFYSLRAAIDEKYVPLSIRNMSCSANIVFLLLLGLAIVYFVMQITLYDKINKNIKNINYSEDRVNNLIDINLQVTSMILITADYNQHAANATISANDTYIYSNTTVTSKLFDTAKTNLKLEATLLKDAQTDLSLKSTQLSESSLAKINPSNVVLKYKNVAGAPVTYTYTIWQAIMEIVVSSYRISTMSISQVDDKSDATVYFVTENSLNNVLVNLDISSSAIMDEIESTRKFNITIFLILLCVASFALLLSTVLLIPVINKVKKNKQEVLELFMHIKKQDANEELGKCRKFLGTFQSNQETELIAAEGEEGQAEGAEEGEAAEATTAGKIKKFDKNKYGTSKRKFKRLVLNLGIVMFKFIFLILIMEAYFILNYFLSSTFLDRVSSLTDELNQLIGRLPTHSFLLLIEKLSIYKDYNLTIKNQAASKYITSYQDQLYSGEEKLLDMFSSNYDYHSSKYNTDFNSIIFSNVCAYLADFSSTQTACEEFNQGILKKGIYSSVIKYWDYLRQVNHDYNNSDRSNASRYKYLNDDDLTVANEMQSVYLNISLTTLVNKLSDDIDSFFTKELNQDTILFVVYIFYLVVVYLFFWRGFISEMQEELWKTKSVLSVLSPEIIMSITEIKTFILNNSSTVFFSKSTHK